jgi:hypothetical protein
MINTPIPTGTSNFLPKSCFDILYQIFINKKIDKIVDENNEIEEEEEDDKNKIDPEKAEGYFDENGEIEWSEIKLTGTIFGATFKQLIFKLFDSNASLHTPYHKIFFLTYLRYF